MAGRKGTNRPGEVPHDLLRQLTNGSLETATLAEALAVDFTILVHHVAPDLHDLAVRSIVPTDGITKRMATVGHLLLAHLGADSFPQLAAHPSDTVRGWAAFVLAAMPDLTLAERLVSMRVLADDHHFAVREWAWLALRPRLVG